MIEIPEILKKSMLFKDISDDDIEGLISKLEMHIKHLEKDEIWAYEGEYVKEIGVILDGSLSVYKTATDGHENLIQKIGKKAVAGIEFVSTKNGMCPYDIRANENTVIYQFKWSYIENYGVIPEKLRINILKNLLMIVSHENIRKTNKIEILMQKGIRDKVMSYLDIQKKKHGTETFYIPFSREELASFLCVNRSALSHELRRMEDDGLIKYKLNQFTVL